MPVHARKSWGMCAGMTGPLHAASFHGTPLRHCDDHGGGGWGVGIAVVCMRGCVGEDCCLYAGYYTSEFRYSSVGLDLDFDATWCLSRFF